MSAAFKQLTGRTPPATVEKRRLARPLRAVMAQQHFGPRPGGRKLAHTIITAEQIRMRHPPGRKRPLQRTDRFIMTDYFA
jgi:hypothetical protein